MAFFDADGVRLYLSEPESADFRGKATLYFRVPDIEAAVAALEARGVVFDERPSVVHRDPSYELWMCFTKDPDGNNIGLMCEVPDGGGRPPSTHFDPPPPPPPRSSSAAWTLAGGRRPPDLGLPPLQERCAPGAFVVSSRARP